MARKNLNTVKKYSFSQNILDTETDAAAIIYPAAASEADEDDPATDAAATEATDDAAATEDERASSHGGKVRRGSGCKQRARSADCQ